MLQEYNIERATSNRSTCRDCSNPIKLDKIRMKEVTQGFHGHPNIRFFCRKCSLIRIKEDMGEQKKLFDSLKARLMEERENV